MLRGDIHLIDLEPSRAGEASKRRPAVIVSNDSANTTAARLGRGVVTVAPITSNVDRVFPFQVLLPSGEAGLAIESKVQAEQVRSVSVQRVIGKLGSVPDDLMQAVDEALRLHLAL